MSQQHPWGAPRQSQSTRLAPISTAFAHEQHRNTTTPSPNHPAPNQSPATAHFPSLPPASSRLVTSRKSSAASSTSSPFSPAGQQLPASQLLSSRGSRTIAPQAASHLASSAAAATQGASAQSNSGGGASKLVRASPSLSVSSTTGSPSASAHSSAASSQNLSRIVIAQIFLLLSQFGPVKDDKDRAKWDTQTEQIRKLVDTNGMEVFTKYFRRVLQNNAATIFGSGARNAEANGSYQILLTEVHKIRKDPEQADKIAESISTAEGDLFRDFDLATFISHFKLDSIAKAMLALACRKTDLRPKADAVLSTIGDDLLMSIAQPVQPDDMSHEYLAALVERLLQDPPPGWDEEKKMSLAYAVQMRYQQTHQQIPGIVESKLILVELTDGARNPLVKLVKQAGPQGTATVEACKEVLASAETRDISYQQVAAVLLYLALSTGYNAKNFVAALREHRTGQRIDWQDVVLAFDRDHLRIERHQFLAIYNALLPVAQENEKFDIQALWGGQWQHDLTQLYFVVAFLSSTRQELDVTQIPRLRTSYSMKTFEGASEDARAFAEEAVRHPFVSLDATAALFNMIFQTSETYHTAQLMGIPDLVINPHTAEFLVAAAAVPKPWGALQEQALKQLFDPYFHKKLPIYNFVLYGLWQQDIQWLVDRFVDAYNADSMTLTLILEHAETNNWLEPLIRSNTDISLDLAAQAHACGKFELEPWLQQTFDQAGPLFRRILTNFLSARAGEEMQRLRDDHQPLNLPLAVKTVYPLLWFLAECGLPEQELLPLQRNCIQAYPRLINYGEGVDDVIDANGQNGNALPEEADKKMQEHFKNMYSGDSDVRDIISALKKYKESRDPADQDLFACMIHGLFDEYNCFGEYPLEALATTAVLFGGIINFNLLSRIALQVGLAMVLEAVQEFRPEDSMYKFGLQALIHFSNRLSEWPNYCDQLLIVPGLQGTEIYAKAEEVVGQQVGEVNGEGHNGMGMTNGNGNGVDENSHQEPAVPKFSCLYVDPPLRPELYEDPDEEVQDKVLFVLNNVSERNLRDKINDLTEAVEERHHQWFANYLVEERAKMQPNFQQLYLDMLDLFNDKMLWAEVLRETYASVVRMLNTDSTLGSTERGHLKNLGSWLGSLTIARDQPIKFRNISFKDLLHEGYDTDRLLLVIPFTCKVLVQAAKSTIFKPPNPWLMEMLGVLMELYHFADLKLNQKFEIEVLCKGLELDHKDIEPTNSIRGRPPVDEEYLGSMVADGMEPFGDLSIMSLNRGARGPNERFSSAAMTAALPDFTNQLQYPPSGNSVVPPATLKKIFLTAVNQAIQEIIAPVVERSVTIAAISTSQLINKDFAMEPDEEKLRSAAHTVVKALSGSLALVTCKEPLRMSIQNNIRLTARDLPEQGLPEGHIIMFVNDNLDLVCNTVEQAAEMSSLAEIDMQIEEAVRIRRMFRSSRPNEPFKDANISPWAFYIPEPYRQMPGGLNREQLAIYEDFGRQSRGAPHVNNTSQDGGRQLPDVLQDQFAAVPNLPTPGAAPAEPRQPAQQQPRLQNLQTPHAAPTQQQPNGYMDAPGLERGQRGVEDLLLELTRVIKEAPEERITDLQPGTSNVHQVFDQLISSIEFAGPNKETWAFRIAGQVTNHLFSDSLSRLEVEVMAHLLSHLCQLSVQTSRQVLMWLATLHDDDRIFKATVMVALMEVNLMDMHRLNTTIAKAIQERRVAAVEMLSSLMDELLLNEHPSAFRADFAMSIDALTAWLAEDSSFELGKRVIANLQAAPNEQSLTPPASGHKDQLEYVFDEWVHLQMENIPKKTVGAFIYQLHQQKVLETQESSVAFIRTCIDASVIAYEQEHSAPYGSGNEDIATVKIDALGRLIVDLLIYQGEQEGATKKNKARYLDQMLVVVVLVLCNHHNTREDAFNQKVFFRLFSTTLFHLNDAVKEESLAEQKADIFLAVAKALLIVQPSNIQRFAFSWLALVAHRIFVPAMLEEGQDDKRWDIYAQLIETLLIFTGKLIKPTGETIMTQQFYRGVLRVLLVIHHDFPEFLVENHFRFCNSIPMHCTQLRNLIVSAYPSTILEMPDPFTAGLKADRLEHDLQAPVIRTDIAQILSDAGIKGPIDSLLKSSELKSQDVDKVCRAVYYEEPKPAAFELVQTTANPTLIHAITLYIGISTLGAGTAAAPIFDAESPATKVIERLAKEFHPEARFHFISAIANQLRFPNTHTHFYSYALLHLFGPPNDDSLVLEIQETITRVLLERLLVHRPHPWGLIITLLEILKNRTYAFWELPFVKAAPEVERLLNALFTHAQQSPRPIA